jgi:hypothetical protein
VVYGILENLIIAAAENVDIIFDGLSALELLSKIIAGDY